MKVLLTGEPRSGKTTLLEGFVEALPNKQGFVTREVRKDGERVGFELVSSIGQTATLASVESDSPIRVSRYGVEVDELDRFIDALPPIQSGNLLYVDEIGQMELFSERFKRLIQEYLGSGNPYAGTITSVYQDEFTQEVLGQEDIILLKVAEANRQQVQEILNGLAASMPLLEQLSPPLQAGVTEMAKKYANTSSYTQLKKLFNNAVKYLAEGRVSQSSPNSFLVKGNDQDHEVTKATDTMECDCDLFNGRGGFVDNAGECSHIQAVKLTEQAD